MNRILGSLLLVAVAASTSVQALADDAKKAPASGQPVSFMKDIAPILVRNCIACHNPKKSESKYIMTTFAQLAKGGQQGEGITLEPGDPDASRFVELLRPDGQPPRTIGPVELVGIVRNDNLRRTATHCCGEGPCSTMMHDRRNTSEKRTVGCILHQQGVAGD